MKRLVSFFEIPVHDFNRAIRFYEQVLDVQLEIMEGETEKMAFFPKEEGECPGAISWTADGSFRPSGDGVLISLSCENMEQALDTVTARGGRILFPKTRIQAEGRGYFSLFMDSEGNKLGLYSDK